MGTTIAAIASPPGSGPRSVLRLSGPRARAIVEGCFAPLEGPLLAQRGVQRGRLDDGRGTQPALLFWMPGPRSYTCEDVAELHLPGAPPLARAALARLFALGAEAAGPGEFTRRAFQNGRIDLSQAEGVLSLVEARTDDERRAATRLLDGGLGRRIEGLRERLEELRALVEASLDFDESDTGHVPSEEITALSEAAALALEQALAWEVARQAPVALPRVLLFGAPNAGKSALWNALAGGRALVADHAGTTRDVNEALWRVGERSFLLCDGPGLEPLEAEGRGAAAAAQAFLARELKAADLCLWLVDGARASGPQSAEALRAEAGALAGSPHLVVWSKADRAPASESGPGGAVPWQQLPPAVRAALGQAEPLAVSSLTGQGLEALGRAVAARFTGEAGALGRELFERHRAALARARAALAEGRAGLAEGSPLDLVAEAFRAATDALDAIVGRTAPEDLLDRIFARFCLGK